MNFFAHHYLPDARPLLFLASALLFGRTWIHYRIWKHHRSMPLLLGLSLVAAFIWIAENLATFAGAWAYPHQTGAWAPVPLTKLGAWFLLMLISYVLVAAVQGVRRHKPAQGEAPAATACKPARLRGSKRLRIFFGTEDCKLMRAVILTA